MRSSIIVGRTSAGTPNERIARNPGQASGPPDVRPAGAHRRASGGRRAAARRSRSCCPNGSGADRPPAPVTIARSAYACPGGSGVSVSAGQVVAGTSATATEPARPHAGRVPRRRDPVATRHRRRGRRRHGPTRPRVGCRGLLQRGCRQGRGAGDSSSGSCPPTADDSWFLGAGSGGKHLTTLVLTNLSSSPAVADVTFWGPAGRIDAIDADGIVVDPFTVRRVDLRDLAAGEAELAVRVERRRGSLAVGALDSSTSVFRGTDALEPTAPPRREQVVAGIPSGSGTRTLLLAEPQHVDGPGRASRWSGRRGRSPRRVWTRSRSTPGSSRAVTVPKSVGSDGAALRLRSDQPVAPRCGSPRARRIAPSSRRSPVLDGAAVVPVDLGIGTRAPAARPHRCTVVRPG